MPITVKAYNGQAWTYDSLEDAVVKVNRSYSIHKLNRGFLNSYFKSSFSDRMVSYGSGDDVVFYDEYGLPIPVWKVKETYNNLPYDVREPPYYYRWLRYHVKDEHYRRMPVPNVRRRHWHREQHVHTFQEIKENSYSKKDEYMHEYKIHVRAHRKSIPDSRDDWSNERCRNRNWKKHRLTQWKAS